MGQSVQRASRRGDPWERVGCDGGTRCYGTPVPTSQREPECVAKYWRCKDGSGSDSISCGGRRLVLLCVAMLKHSMSLAEMQVEGRLGGIRVSALGSRWVALFVVVVALLISL